jgi:3-hydroxybutyryl-CoA dehydratase
MRFDEMKAGDAAELSKTITDADIVLFAGISGDFNPVHMDQQAAERSRFGGRIAHGMLTASLISGVLGMRLPGPGAIYLNQSLRFTGPVKVGDTVTARVEVLELIPAKQRVRVATTCRKQTGETVLDGEALLWVPDPS